MTPAAPVSLLLSQLITLRRIAAFDRLMLGELSPATRALIAAVLGGAV